MYSDRYAIHGDLLIDLVVDCDVRSAGCFQGVSRAFQALLPTYAESDHRTTANFQACIPDQGNCPSTHLRYCVCIRSTDAARVV